MNPARSFSKSCISFTARYPRSRTAVILLVGLSVWTVGVSEGQAEDKGRAKRKKPDFREVVKGLVSPNSPIEVYDEDSLRYPPKYDSAAQVPIEKNRRLLYERCEEALPFLIEGCTDTRYSLTWNSDAYAGSSCVGEVCLEIVASHLEVYRNYTPSLRSKTRYYEYRFVPRINGAIGEKVTEEKQKEIQAWWHSRKNKSLLELQIEAFDWAIEKRKQEQDGKEEVSHLITARDKLKQDGKCLPPLSIPPSVKDVSRTKTDK